MNLGQFITQYSPLPTGSVAQHLLAIGQHQGSGADRLIYCSQINVVTRQHETVVVRKPSTKAEVAGPTQPVQEVAVEKWPKSVFVKRQESLSVTAVFIPDEITVVRRTVEMSCQVSRFNQ